MWPAIGRGLLWGFGALGLADVFGIGGNQDGRGSNLWSNPIVIILLLITIVYALGKMGKIKITT